MSVQVITLTTTGSSSPINISDLDGLTINHPSTIELQRMYLPERLTRSTDLQLALDSGEITLTNNYGSVTSVDRLLSSPGEDTWMLLVGRNLTNLGDQYYRDANSIRHDLNPYRIGQNCEIISISATNRDDNGSWTIGIDKSTTGSDGVYTEIWTGDVTSGATDFTLSSSLNTGDHIRVYQSVSGAQVAPDYPKVSITFKATT